MPKAALLLCTAIAGLASSAAQAGPVPPVAPKRPHAVTAPFGAVRQDEYYWLRDDTRKNPEVLAHLAAENAYTDAVMAPLQPLRDKIYAEMIGRIKQDDASVPYLQRGYWYYTRYETGAEYPIRARRKGSMTAPEEILFNGPAMARGHGFFQLAGTAISPDNRLAAWTDDTVGRRQYVLRVKDLATGKPLADEIRNVEPGIVWADDNRSILYIEKDPVTLLSKRVKMHRLGTPASADRLVYEEPEDSFYLALSRTADDRFICLHERSTVSDEERCAPASAPDRLMLLAPREREFRYDADHAGDRWILRTNLQAPNYRLMTVSDADAAKGRGAWTELVPTSDTAMIDSFRPFTGFIAITQRGDANTRLRIVSNDGRDAATVPADEPAYSMSLGRNEEVDTPWVRYTYTSLVSPTKTYDVNAATGERRLLKAEQVPGYDPARYVTERVWATARDGTRIPVSLFYAKGLKRDGTAPLFQYAYGSYGYSSDPDFSNYAVSLADRGIVFAIAHVRGGQEMGRAWYDAGHLLQKRNSFTDFIDVTRALVAQRYVAKGRAAALGGSAGGLLMSGVANMAPDDYAVIIPEVPFVDVVTTMLDASIPLTTNEYDEWGNPGQKRFYDYMLSYSPYDNIRAQAYPAMFVSTGLWDSQVQYYEPTKYVARLRATKTDANPLLFRINMEAGHGGKSGRFEAYRDTAEYLAFAIDRLEKRGPTPK